MPDYTLFSLDGFTLLGDRSSGDQVTTGVAPSQVSMVTAIGQPTFSYTVTGTTDGGLSIISLDGDIDDSVLVNSNMLSDAEEGFSRNYEVSIGELVWTAGGRTQVLNIRFESDDGIYSQEHIFRLGGAELPAVLTIADFQAVQGLIASVEDAPSTGSLAPGQLINLNSLPGVTSVDLDWFENAVDARDLTFTSGNDVALVGGAGGSYYINATAGDDIYAELGGATSPYNFYQFIYSSMATGITVDIDQELGIARVDKGAAGTDTLLNLTETVLRHGSQDAWITGTNHDDVFNLSLGESPWFAVSMGGGDDVVNISGTGITRVSYRYLDQSALPTMGVIADLSTGLVSQDGFGGQDTINVLEDTVNLEFQGTHHADSILGSSRDERFILRGGNDTLDAGAGEDLLRYDRSGVADLVVDLEAGQATGTWNGEAFTHQFTGVEHARSGRDGGSWIAGDDGANELTSSRSSDDTLVGRDGNDTFVDYGGSDVVFGGEGFDTHRVDGLFLADVTVTGSVFSGVTVTSHQGVDVLYDVELLDLWDGDIDLTLLAEATATASNDELFGSLSDDVLSGLDGDDDIMGRDGNDRLDGGIGNDTLEGGDGVDTLIGGEGNDSLIGGDTEDDLRDVIYGGNGNDLLDGGYGNDELRGDGGMDTITGGFGVDDIFGGDGDDQLTGQAWSDLIFGGAGDDFINGGFGYDRVNGGAGADRFFHLGVADHGSDWIQDYTATDGDVLQFGQAGTSDQFQVNFTETTDAGAAGVDEAFVIYRPTGQILWALVDGGAQSEINLLMGGVTYDLMA